MPTGRAPCEWFRPTLGVSGDRAGGQRVVDEMLSLSHRGYVSPEYIAMAYEGVGQRQQALSGLRRRMPNGR